jgi:hypothetical protein
MVENFAMASLGQPAQVWAAEERPDFVADVIRDLVKATG